MLLSEHLFHHHPAYLKLIVVSREEGLETSHVDLATNTHTINTIRQPVIIPINNFFLWFLNIIDFNNDSHRMITHVLK